MDTKRNQYNNPNYRDKSYHNNQKDQEPTLKRVSIEPENKSTRLERHEIGIKSGLKGNEIKTYIDRVIQKLVYLKYDKITLKAIGKQIFLILGNACSKVLSIADILRRKIKGLSLIHHNDSKKYVAKYESEDVININ